MVSSSGAVSHLPATDLLSSPVLHRLPRDETIVFYTQACERTRCAGSKSGPRRSHTRLSLAETRPSAVSRGPARPAAPALPAAALAPRAGTQPRRRAAWLRIFVVRCSLPCDPPVGGHSCNEG